MESKYSIHFITYANNKFEVAKQRLLKQANNFYNFKTIRIKFCTNYSLY